MKNAKTCRQSQQTEAMALLNRYRRIMDSIHKLGNIYENDGRMEAYNIVALLASRLRKDLDLIRTLQVRNHVVSTHGTT